MLSVLVLLTGCIWSSHGVQLEVNSRQPEQVHLAIGEIASTYVVTWATLEQSGRVTVLYGQSEMDKVATGSTAEFIDGGTGRRKVHIHRATLTDLQPMKTYMYKCGSNHGWSKQFTFKTKSTKQNWSPTLLVYGDMGIENNVILPYVKRVVQSENIDAILHVGDFAYDMHNNESRYADEFMRQIEPVASTVPYMTAPGNHEAMYNFSNYKARFSMPGGDGQSQYYSFDLGPAHFIAYSTELYYYLYYGCDPVINQYKWLEENLMEANKPERRKLHPWIIVYGHRPMYCSNTADAISCELKNNLARTGFAPHNNRTSEYTQNLEQLFYKYGVDIILTAHEHSYERHWPLYNMTVCNGSTEHPYLEPDAPVHVVTGAGGCVEEFNWFYPNRPYFSAFRALKYGYTKMQVSNDTHVTFQQYGINKDGSSSIIDSFHVMKSVHGMGLYTCHLKQTNVN